MQKSEKMRIDCLDGLRGIAAVWVIVGHALILTGWRVPLLGDPDLGVDLFILLSGFLMVFNYPPNSRRQPWNEVGSSTNFWKRRFFRIAPLYYLMLVIALLWGQHVYESRVIIDTFLAVPGQLPERYLDSSLANFAMHFSFLYGFFPDYAFRSALPDWSIGLEMQFYLAFPVFMLIVQKQGWIKGSVAIVIGGIAIAAAVYLAGIRFPMPSFLPLKLHVFVSGMLLAGALGASRKTAFTHLLLAILFVLVPFGGGLTFFKEVVRVVIVTGFFLLVHHAQLPRAFASVFQTVADKFIGNKFARVMGDFSFGAYLIHLLVLQPVIADLVVRYGQQMSNPVRCLFALAITLPIVYALAAIAYYFIEVPGQKLGRLFIRRPAKAV